jgi:hypothetical protein
MEMFNNSKITNLFKNKYGNFVLHKALQLLKPEDKADLKELVMKKLNNAFNKEKSKYNDLLELF